MMRRRAPAGRRQPVKQAIFPSRFKEMIPEGELKSPSGQFIFSPA